MQNQKRPRHRSKHTRARNSGADAASTYTTVGAAIGAVSVTLERATLVYGHGTDNPMDEAAALVFKACGYRHEDAPAAYGWAVDEQAAARLDDWVFKRINARVPSAYLTGESSFADLWFSTDNRALIPRSPLAEFIMERGEPFIDSRKVARVLDIGTGSGCIAIAMAHYFENAQVDAADVSLEALALCVHNAKRLGLESRVRPVVSDVFSGLAGCTYDVIISNPPYVPTEVVDGLADEYHHEPRLGLDAGADGLSIVSQILQRAARHLNPGGILVVEVGETQAAVMDRWPQLPFLWLSFHNGGDGVFLLTREQCLNGG